VHDNTTYINNDVYRYLYFASRVATNTIKTVTKQAHTHKKTDFKRIKKY